MFFINYIFNRLNEKSTWAGIGVFVGAVAAALGEHLPLYAALMAGAASILAPTSGGKK